MHTAVVHGGSAGKSPATKMTPAGYMAKRVSRKPEWLKAARVIDVYSLSGCISGEFADYIKFWKHNGHGLFDSPGIIQSVARENSLDLEGTSLFYYEEHEREFNGKSWLPIKIPTDFPTNVLVPGRRRFVGVDVVSFSAGTMPECSPLSCNGLAETVRTNQHCLLSSIEEAETSLENGLFRNCEPGPYRIFAVYSVDWP